MQTLEKALPLFSDPGLLVSCVSRNNEYSSFVAFIKRTKGMDACLFFSKLLKRCTLLLLLFPLHETICTGYHPCALLNKRTRTRTAFKMQKHCIFTVSPLWCLYFVNCWWVFLRFFLNIVVLALHLSCVAVRSLRLEVVFVWLRWSFSSVN